MTPVCSVYSQLCNFFHAEQFAQVVKQHQAEFNARGSLLEQFVAMLFCQVAHLNSLREVCLGLAGCESPLKHLGISTAPEEIDLGLCQRQSPLGTLRVDFMQLLESVRPRRRRAVAASFASRTS